MLSLSSQTNQVEKWPALGLGLGLCAFLLRASKNGIYNLYGTTIRFNRTCRHGSVCSWCLAVLRCPNRRVVVVSAFSIEHVPKLSGSTVNKPHVSMIHADFQNKRRHTYVKMHTTHQSITEPSRKDHIPKLQHGRHQVNRESDTLPNESRKRS